MTTCSTWPVFLLGNESGAFFGDDPMKSIFSRFPIGASISRYMTKEARYVTMYVAKKSLS